MTAGMVHVVTDEVVRIDVLAAALLGRADGGRLEALLAANPGMAGLGLYAVAGDRVRVPDLPSAPAAVPAVLPWE